MYPDQQTKKETLYIYTIYEQRNVILSKIVEFFKTANCNVCGSPGGNVGSDERICRGVYLIIPVTTLIYIYTYIAA